MIAVIGKNSQLGKSLKHLNKNVILLDLDYAITAIENPLVTKIIYCIGFNNTYESEKPENKDELFYLNSYLPYRLSKFSIINKKHFICFSTNYVFSGSNEKRYYTITDKTEPFTMYGKSKEDLEKNISTISKDAKISIIRTSHLVSKYDTIHNLRYKLKASVNEGKVILDDYRVLQITECEKLSEYLLNENLPFGISHFTGNEKTVKEFFDSDPDLIEYRKNKSFTTEIVKDTERPRFCLLYNNHKGL